MNYEMFKEIAKEQIILYMPEKFRNYSVEVSLVTKVNTTLDGLNILSPDKNSHQNPVPTIYLNHMYEDYQRSKDLEKVLQSAADQIASIYQNLPSGLNNIVADRDKVVMTLVNTEQNRELLANVPHRKFQDLSIVYRCILEMTKDDIKSYIITNHSAESMFHMYEHELYAAAMENTRKLLPPVMKNMNDVIFEILQNEGMSKEMFDEFIDDMPAERTMYMLSNSIGINGAASMLYHEELQKLAEKMGTDLYIMPSSTHEVIVLSADVGDPNELSNMVMDINMTQVSLNDRLSNQVYHYDKDLRTLTLASDTPCKRLDGRVAEGSLHYESKQSR